MTHQNSMRELEILPKEAIITTYPQNRQNPSGATNFGRSEPIGKGWKKHELKFLAFALRGGIYVAIVQPRHPRR